MKNNINISIKRFFTFLSIFLSSFYYLHSQDISFSDPYAEKLLFNPAYSGLGNCSAINFTYNKGYLSNFYSTSYNRYIDKYKSGVGTVISNNNQGKGAINNLNINFIYNYKIKFTTNRLVNTAFQATYIQQNINTKNLIFNNQINPINGQTSLNTNELSFKTYKNIDFSFATAYISKNYRMGIVINHIDKTFINSITQLKPALKIHLAKLFYLKNKYFLASKSIIAPEIIYDFQNNFHKITYAIHIINNIFLTRFYIKHNLKFNTISSTITLGINIRKARLSYSYTLSSHSKITMATSANQISLQYNFNCAKKRNNKNTIYCLKI